MKIKLYCTQTFETVIPASKMISQNLLTGEEWDAGIDVPESRWTTEAGKIITVTKGESKKLVKTGRWMEVSK